jgi:predicted TIM-barrel fold metal-dependent hydrolase
VIDGMFVFDCVIHAYDLSDANLHAGERGAEAFREHLVRVGAQTRPAADAEYDFRGRWTVDAVHKLVFEDAPTDMAMAQTVPIFDWFEDFFAPARAQYELARRYPEKVLFCGGVDPLHRGLDAALEELEHQVRELGAVSMKFYNGHVPRSWRCDDERVAYPLYERCRELGVRVLQFHKGLPLGLQNVEDLSPVDLQAAARDFPDLTFVIHHLGLPYFDETVSIAARFENVYLALSGNINHALIAPRLVQERLGRLLQEVGSDKLLWGSEAALAGSPAPYLRAFLELEIPADLRSGYGYPQITREDKERILGLNFAALMGVDVPTAAAA